MKRRQNSAMGSETATKCKMKKPLNYDLRPAETVCNNTSNGVKNGSNSKFDYEVTYKIC